MLTTTGNDFRSTTNPLHLDVGTYDPRLRRELGDFLKGFAWSHFIILTTRRPGPPDRLLSRFTVYIRSLERIAQCRVGWFVAVEERVPGWGHLHALAAGTEHLTVARLERQWRHGFNRVRKYDPARRGCHYSVKDITDEWHHDLFDLSLPRRNRVPGQSLPLETAVRPAPPPEGRSK